MKYIIRLSFFFLGMLSFYNAQIAIGKATVDGDGLLDFQNPTTKGLLLPRVSSPDPNSVPGTILYNVNTQKIEFLDNNGWLDFSSEQGYYDTSHPRYTALQEEQDLNGVIIGEEFSTAPGILVLESTEKALILPKMENPHLTIRDPEAGMMAYDTVSKTLFLFDGVHWTVWGQK